MPLLVSFHHATVRCSDKQGKSLVLVFISDYLAIKLPLRVLPVPDPEHNSDRDNLFPVVPKLGVVRIQARPACMGGASTRPIDLTVEDPDRKWLSLGGSLLPRRGQAVEPVDFPPFQLTGLWFEQSVKNLELLGRDRLGQLVRSLIGRLRLGGCPGIEEPQA